MPEDKQKFNLPETEEKILKFWEENRIFEKSLEKTRKGKPFVFYEGPPTANGMPGVHHAEVRSFKDVILRYKTMRGFYVPRKAGWDTHGLPVEIEVEKQLGFKTKQDIEKYGLAKFNQKAKESVWRYKDEWEKATKRLGFWLDLKNPYITYETSYIETLWWIIKEVWKKGLLVEDFKVVPWCPRCETGLSSHEVGLGYKKVRENSVYVKLKIKNKKDEYLLIWTTTPWTLPANIGVALNPKIEYTKYKVEDEYLWSAVTPPYGKDEKVSVVEKVSGKSLLGLKYEPLFRVPKDHSLGGAPEYKVIVGDFVSTVEGTGMVHLAPAFGDEDMAAAKKEWKSDYPILHTVNPNGTMKKGVVGEGKFVKEADSLITEDLKRRGLIYKIVSYEHDYPFCWRCDTPLLYFAREAWWIKMRSLREKLLANNEKINWTPEHIKHGRFGEFLEEVRDWAFSRERYWGTPLPIWKCANCAHVELVGSRKELANLAPLSKNSYLIMRHGEALSNVKNIVSHAKGGKLGLTFRGKIQVERAVKKLKKQNTDLIFASDVLRTKETADLVARALGVKVYTDARLREVNTGIFEGRPPREYFKYFSSRIEKFTKKPPGGETLTELRKRVFEFLEDTEKKYAGKKILIVSHEYPLWMLYSASGGLTNEEAVAFKERRPKEDFIGFAEIMELPIKNLPRDENKEINLHRPYVDSVSFGCKKCKGAMRRVPEVADVWFDSGSMPWASQTYADLKIADIRGKVLRKSALAKSQRESASMFPADYICEAVDQTRGWFYTLLAVATLLGKGAPYKNVISLGHVLDKNGQKMSKSKGNVVDPKVMIEKYGADALRWYFYTINPPGEPKRFDEKDLFNKLRGFLMTFWNSFVLFDTYVESVPILALNGKKAKLGTTVLDRWVLAKLQELASDTTRKLDSYDITGAARDLENFVINDFSQWYLRRSRRRFQKPESKKEKDEAAATTAYVLLTVVKLLAPFAPFIAEEIYQKLRKKMALKEASVHLLVWSKSELRIRNKELRILKDMQTVREVVAEALKLRAEAGVKVRQPLQELRIKNQELKNKKELLNLIKDEVNVKEITFGDELKLDTKITSELKEEGIVREFIRNIQEMRRDLGLKPRDVIRCQVSGAEDIEIILSKWSGTIKKDVNAREFKVGGKKEFKIERELDFRGLSLWVGIDRI